jgi:hypothetical protein
LPAAAFEYYYYDQQIYMAGLIRFIQDVAAGRFPSKT